MARVYTISIPKCVSEAAEKRQIITRTNIKMRHSTERVKTVCNFKNGGGELKCITAEVYSFKLHSEPLLPTWSY